MMTKKLFVCGAVSVALLWIGGMVWFAQLINNFEPQLSAKVDAAIVLTGGRNRIAAGLKLIDEGYVQRLFISGVGKDISLDDIQNTQHLQLDKKRIEIGHKAADTFGNAAETASWVAKNNIKSIFLVTSNYHMMRALAEFHNQIPELKIIPYPVYSEKIEKKWWTSWRTFSLLCKEYNKFLYVRLCGLQGRKL